MYQTKPTSAHKYLYFKSDIVKTISRARQTKQKILSVEIVSRTRNFNTFYFQIYTDAFAPREICLFSCGIQCKPDNRLGFKKFTDSIESKCINNDKNKSQKRLIFFAFPIQTFPCFINKFQPSDVIQLAAKLCENCICGSFVSI